MTDKELIQALQCCNEPGGWCSDCPRVGYGEELLECVTNVHNEAIDRLEALLAENEHLREVAKMMQRWVSVEERLPDDTPDYVMAMTAESTIPQRWPAASVARYPEYFTHWMPLPEPPSTEGVE